MGIFNGKGSAKKNVTKNNTRKAKEISSFKYEDGNNTLDIMKGGILNESINSGGVDLDNSLDTDDNEIV